ncbi:hypothetical protein HK098_007545 [Nowakowskiella sp. JEL0407]|nr:hypothetical protein HK098_007545 [Nowakowskiella sp. JEL0407]
MNRITRFNIILNFKLYSYKYYSTLSPLTAEISNPGAFPIPNSPSPINKSRKLRPYQLECIEKCLERFESGVRRQSVSLPVGSGKTFVFTSLMKRFPPPNPQATKVLVLAHREELLDQARRSIIQEYPDLESKVGKDQGLLEPHDIDKYEVIVASVPTLGRKSSNRLHKYDPSKFKMIIIDEVKTSGFKHNRNLENLTLTTDEESHIRLWGCSATLNRADGMSLSKTFESVVYQKPILELIQEGWLCKMKVSTVKTSVNLSDIKLTQSDFSIPKLGAAVNVPERNTAVIYAWMKAVLPEGDENNQLVEKQDIHKVLLELEAWKHNKTPDPPEMMPRIDTTKLKRKSTLVFAASVKHIKDLVDGFKYCGVDSVGYVHGEMSFDMRSHNLKMFAEGKISVLVNCGIVTEGVDIPNIDCVLLARPTASSVLLQQMIGRGLRLCQGKEDCLLLDFHDVVNNKIQLATIPTLAGLDPQFSFEGDFETLHKKAAPLVDHLNTMQIPPGCYSLEQLENLAKFLDAPKEPAPFVIDDYIPQTIRVEIGRERDLFTEKNSKPPEIKFRHRFRMFDYDCMMQDTNELKKISELQWVRIGEAEFALALRNNTTFRISKISGDPFGKTDDVYEVTERRRLTNTRNSSLPRKIVRTTTRRLMFGDLASCFTGCKIYMYKTCYDQMPLLLRSAKWRTHLASPTQISFLQKRKLNIIVTSKNSIPCWKWQSPNDLPGKFTFIPVTKGLAADIVTQFLEGGIKNEKEQDKSERAAEKMAAKVLNNWLNVSN